MSSCLHEDEFERYHAQQMSEEEVAWAEAHFQVCRQCTRRLAEFQETVNKLRDIRLEGLADLDPATLAPPTPSQVAGMESADRAVVTASPEIEGYRIIDEIHRGGQGIVYRAVQETTQRQVAIKILLEGQYASPTARKRFDREVALVAQLKHPNIITIFDSGETSDGLRYYVMDYIEGEPLNKHIRKHGISVKDALRLFASVCRGVHHAHQQGVIHRDLKPSNILVDTKSGNGEGAPRVLDFGLAKMLAGGVETRVSMTGQVFGTLPYMAPEQVRGQTNTVDARTDVYALGVVLYELLTGRYPYPVEGQLADVLKHIEDTPPTPPSRAWTADDGIAKSTGGRKRPSFRSPIDTELETITLRCLAKEPERRYQTTQEVADDIHRYLDGEAIHARRESRLYVLRKSIPRHKVALAITLAVVVVCLSVIVVSTMRGRLREQRQRERQAFVRQCQDAIMLMDANRLFEILERAEEVKLDRSSYHGYLGWAYTIRLQTKRGRAEADRALQENGENPIAHYLRASINAYEGNYVQAGLDFANAQKHAGDSLLERGMNGMLKGLMGQYEQCITELDALVIEQRGSPAVLWIRGFSHWFRILSHPPIDVDERWAIGRNALADMDAAARLYPTVAFIFDARADLLRRMARMSEVRGHQSAFDDSVARIIEDGNKIMELGARGNGLRVLCVARWLTGDYEKALEYADASYDALTGSDEVHAVNREDALDSIILWRMWLRWVLGRDDEAIALSKDLQARHPAYANTFVSGFLAAQDPTNQKALMEDNSELPVGYHRIGLWCGARFIGEAKLARHLARRFELSLVDRLKWNGALVQFVRGRSSISKILSSAGEHVHRQQVAYLCAALLEDNEEKRSSFLERVSMLAYPSRWSEWAEGVAYRTQRDRVASEPQ